MDVQIIIMYSTGNTHNHKQINCLIYFFRSCPEIDDETMAAKIEEFEVPRRQFHEANKHLQEKVCK